MQNLSRPSHIGIYSLDVATSRENIIKDSVDLLQAAKDIVNEYDEIYIQNVKNTDVWQGHIPDHLFVKMEPGKDYNLKLFPPTPHKERFAVEQKILRKFFEINKTI